MGSVARRHNVTQKVERSVLDETKKVTSIAGVTGGLYRCSAHGYKSKITRGYTVLMGLVLTLFTVKHSVRHKIGAPRLPVTLWY